ncbi:MAG: NAD(P)-binding domain-containing protein, partial [Caldilineaceae bacterium]|nr:NAD(P)-binding domain-containing protein [Caldilineaceae bacterium]
MKEQAYQIGMIGLGVMGRNFALNMAEHGFAVVGYDRATEQVAQLEAAAGELPLAGARSIEQFVAALTC